MNTLEILYQAFRVRYSLNQLQQILDRGCRLALLAPEGGASTLRGFLGEPIVGLDEGHPDDDLIMLDWSLDESAVKELRTCDACVVYFPEGPPDVETLEALAEKIPLHVKTLWICETDNPQAKTYHEKDLTLPTVRTLPTVEPGPHFLRLLLASLPQISLVLARDWTLLRETFCQILTRRTALRNGVRAGISSLPLRSVPGIGPVLAMLATSAETMMLTSSQLRLSFVIAAVHGRPLDFFDRISELWPIVGSAFGFRGFSRYLTKLLPGGFRPGTKASIAFAGTFAVGEASRLYYHMGQPDSDEVRRELLRRSHETGAKEAQLLFRRILAGQSIDEVGVGGTEVIDLVEGLTTVEQVFADPVVGGAIAESRDHEEQKLREAVAEELAHAEIEQLDLIEESIEESDSPAIESTVEIEPTVEVEAVVPEVKSVSEAVKAPEISDASAEVVEVAPEVAEVPETPEVETEVAEEASAPDPVETAPPAVESKKPSKTSRGKLTKKSESAPSDAAKGKPRKRKKSDGSNRESE